jgi:hypothetical protein
LLKFSSPKSFSLDWLSGREHVAMDLCYHWFINVSPMATESRLKDFRYRDLKRYSQYPNPSAFPFPFFGSKAETYRASIQRRLSS